MSGGVDSSVAAWLLQQAGHDVVGLFMRHGVTAETACSAKPGKGGLSIVEVAEPPPAHKKGCCTAADAADARRVADRLDIPFYALNFDDAFGRIMDYFVEEYSAGRTPNPCVVCNNWLKFGRLWEYAQSIGADYVATGHYARLEGGSTAPRLCRGRDAGKDQSYVLFGIERRLLPRLLFPVGRFRKDEIRDMARGLGLRVADKKDSQEICFVPDGDYAAFVRRRRGDQDLSGEIVTTEGQVVGHHGGLENFTIGQRRGLGVAVGEPRYVVRLERETRRVVIGPRDQLAVGELTAQRVNWLVDPPQGPLKCQVQIRYASRPTTAWVEPLQGARFRAKLDEPRLGVAPGQAVVCYHDDQLLGGGWIE